MEEIKIIQHNGKEIILIDYSQCGRNSDRVIAIATELGKTLCSMPLNSALTLTDVRNLHYCIPIIDKFKETTSLTKKHIKHQAIIGVDGNTKKFLLNTITSFSGITMPLFDSQEEAIEWLVSQP